MKSEFIKLAMEYGMDLETANTYYTTIRNPEAFLSLGLLRTGL